MLARLGCDCYGGCWGDHSQDWPSIEYTIDAGLLAKENLPYGSYVISGDRLRIGAQTLAEGLQALHAGNACLHESHRTGSLCEKAYGHWGFLHMGDGLCWGPSPVQPDSDINWERWWA